MPRISYEQPDQGDDPLPDPFKNADIALAREMGKWLLENYPKQASLFHATINHAQGVATLRMPMLMGGTNVFILHIPMLQQGPTIFQMEMRQAAGELLERYGLPRGRNFDQDGALERIKQIPRIGLDQRPVPE